MSGILADDLDGWLQRIDSVIQNGIEPRITYTIKPISTGDNAYLILLHIEKSWNRPHRVIFGGHDKFYSRNSAGKYSLDTFELRDMFTFSNTLTEKITIFKNERIIALLNGDSPVPIARKGNVILHFIPFDSFTPMKINLNQMKENSMNLGLLFWQGWNSTYNLNGYLLYSPYNNTCSYDYTQLFRNGIIEAVDGLLFNRELIPMHDFEKSIVKYFTKAIAYFKAINIQPPIYFSISLINIRGYGIPGNNAVYSSVWGMSVITTDIIKLPESIIYDFDIKPETVLQPMFDIIWNACGCEKSNNFDEQGNFIFYRN
jgi:hypothetical protein